MTRISKTTASAEIIIEILRDDAGAFTGDERKSYFYRVRLASGTQADLRWRDLPEQPQS